MSKVKDVKTKSVTMDIGGRKRVIQYDLNSYAELEERYGSVKAALEGIQNGKTKNIRVLLWAGLIHEEAIVDEITGEPTGYNITPYQVGSWITPNLLPEVSEKINEAMSFGMPDIQDIPGADKILAEQGLEVRDGQVKYATVEGEEVKNG